LDDVSRLNATEVGCLVQPLCLGDVQDAIARARAAGRRVSVRGTKHSMGGHTLVPDGVVLDMAYVNHMTYHLAAPAGGPAAVAEEGSSNGDSHGAGYASVTVGTGATWAELIRFLNPHGKTPRTLQSYATFSVGGSLSVNAHGITSDHCVAESVLQFTLVKADGSVVTVRRGDELFRLCLGGYGLFGVIWDVTLRVDDNHRVAMDATSVPLADVPHIYQVQPMYAMCERLD
jgi:FAD/FMN-containing dehydrogenase